MPPRCTCLFCIGWIRKCTKTYNKCKELHHSLNPLICQRFCCHCGLYKVPAVAVYKSHHVDISVFCLLLHVYFPFLTSESQKCSLSFSTLEHSTEKFCSIRPENFQKFTMEVLVVACVFSTHGSLCKCYCFMASAASENWFYRFQIIWTLAGNRPNWTEKVVKLNHPYG